MRISVAWSPRAGEAHERSLEVDDTATIAEALRLCDLVVAPGDSVGIWGRPATASTTLADGDRVEIHRPLAIDPKEARRRRVRRTATAGSRPKRRS